MNGVWKNGVTSTYFNASAGPHEWSNISVWAYNNSGGGSLSLTSASHNIQVPNNPPIQLPIGDKEVYKGQLLTFKIIRVIPIRIQYATEPVRPEGTWIAVPGYIHGLLPMAMRVYIYGNSAAVMIMVEKQLNP